MRTTLLRLVVLTMLLAITLASAAYAHVVVSPEEVPVGDYEKLTVSAPTEREVPTTQIRVEVPEGFEVLGVRPEPGWDYDFEEEAGAITAVTWSGGEIEPREFQEFTIQTRTPEEGGEFAWNAFQTYENGEVVEWTGPEGSEEEASLVRVTGGAEGSGEAGAAAQEESSSDASGTGGFTPVAAYSGLGVGALALAVALVALLRGRKT